MIPFKSILLSITLSVVSNVAFGLYTPVKISDKTSEIVFFVENSDTLIEQLKTLESDNDNRYNLEIHPAEGFRTSLRKFKDIQKEVYYFLKNQSIQNAFEYKDDRPVWSDLTTKIMSLIPMGAGLFNMYRFDADMYNYYLSAAQTHQIVQNSVIWVFTSVVLLGLDLHLSSTFNKEQKAKNQKKAIKLYADKTEKEEHEEVRRSMKELLTKWFDDENTANRLIDSSSMIKYAKTL